ncbi:hypothetical protein LEP1GSC058_0679 [Leptospira fainei serovar Hurstbridge str. BUT 6]|uniref:Uncharacterized protein n=1 Tax=Leptospira fainei serovar Hurstbridge str. BUT 6 TaxID=1193011 RepID=S3V516_9LEPT|nr:hypothetical protein LEP1GSC058_0679 [Leptospira fainei serovar Hurstbridge str. BUT 6]
MRSRYNLPFTSIPTLLPGLLSKRGPGMGNLFAANAGVSPHSGLLRKGKERRILDVPHPPGRGPDRWKYALYIFLNNFAMLFLTCPNVGAPTKSFSLRQRAESSVARSHLAALDFPCLPLPFWRNSLNFIQLSFHSEVCDIILLYSHYNLTLEKFFPTVNLFIGPVQL